MRYTNIINKIKANKRILYLSFCIVLILFSLVLNITFSKYTSNLNSSNANIVIGDLKYNMVINEVELSSSVGTKLPSNTIIGDRIILLKSNETEQFNINLTSLNNFDTKYEITYKVCTDVNCTDFYETIPSSIDIYYHEDTPYINGVLSANKSVIVSLVTSNYEDEDYFVQIDLNVGYSHNTLALTNLISEAFSNTILKSNLSVLAYVNGVQVNAFPETDNYNTSVSCKSSNSTSNIVGTVRWSSNKWIINIASIDSTNTTCTVIFVNKDDSEIEAPTNWYQAKDGTLLAGIRKNYVTATSAATTPGKSVSVSTEKVLASTSDDYGTSFYFRGAVKNNYVQFAGKCWRIVRITGNGAIKLVLHNDNVNKVSNPCDASNNNSNAAFARYSGTTYTSVFNNSNGSNADIGFMYGTPGSSTYAAEHADKVDSTILTNLKKWYDTYLSGYDDKIADVIYCNDKSVYKSTSYSPWNIGTLGTNYGVGSNRNFYSASARFSASDGSSNGSGPTLICPNDNLGGKLSKFTSEDTVNGNGALNGYKIGLLSADEIGFAGASFQTANSTYYLYENASGSNWWTASPFSFPCYFNINSATMIYVGSGGGLTFYIIYDSYAVRPSIALVPDVTISSGTGTSSDPFVVN